jgi:hypothetical protein
MTVQGVKEDANDYDIFMGVTEVGECILEWRKCLLFDRFPVSLSEFLGLPFSHCVYKTVRLQRYSQKPNELKVLRRN